MKSTISFDEFKLNSDGMIPVITQDYKTNEVLMLAYMTKESFEKTLETGLILAVAARNFGRREILPDIISM